MIDTTQKELITAAFGKHYTGKVITHLTAKEIFNDESKPFSVSQIKHIVCGNTENEVVAAELVNASILILKEKNKQQKKLQDQANQLLKP